MITVTKYRQVREPSKKPPRPSAPQPRHIVSNDDIFKLILDLSDSQSQKFSNLTSGLSKLSKSVESLQCELASQIEDIQKIKADVHQIKIEAGVSIEDGKIKFDQVIDTQASRIRNIKVVGLRKPNDGETDKMNFIKALKHIGCDVALSEIDTCVEVSTGENNDKRVVIITFTSATPLRRLLEANMKLKKTKAPPQCKMRRTR